MSHLGNKYLSFLSTLKHKIFPQQRERESGRQREGMEGEKGTVCVTGGTGFIASHLIMKLLHCGYNVRATVRPDPGNSKMSP